MPILAIPQPHLIKARSRAALRAPPPLAPCPFLVLPFPSAIAPGLGPLVLTLTPLVPNLVLLTASLSVLALRPSAPAPSLPSPRPAATPARNSRPHGAAAHRRSFLEKTPFRARAPRQRQPAQRRSV